MFIQPIAASLLAPPLPELLRLLLPLLFGTSRRKFQPFANINNIWRASRGERLGRLEATRVQAKSP